MTVAALAQIPHGNDRSFMRIDCEEFQLDHEVGKLVGAPPGYLGHRETAPRLNQSKLNAVASDRCGLSLILFDEVEKAAESLHRMLLGVFDHGRLTLGDNTPVDFSRTLIFMTSNVGQKDMLRELQNKGVGFPGNDNPVSDTRLDTITNSRLRRSFSAEFLNRIDSFVTYHPLTRENISSIFDLEFDKLRIHILVKLDSAKTVSCTTAAKDEIVDIGLSPEFGAREIKRLLNKHLLQALAGEMTSGERRPKHVNLDFAAGQFFLSAV
jgi:ATP-dependent Clp protease ATP-binding subunit ClpA